MEKKHFFKRFFVLFLIHFLFSSLLFAELPNCQSSNPKIQYFCKRYNIFSDGGTNYWVDFLQVQTVSWSTTTEAKIRLKTGEEITFPGINVVHKWDEFRAFLLQNPDFIPVN